ncbi:macro domain-containing protein [Candidatus Woesearchaeota archaeon]|nr:macro domain-containing protein [Candidatus Woesearchaeota archaeon]
MRETYIPAIEVRKASIATIQVDAVVNPANSFGYMGGGVAEVMKKVGGQVIEDEAVAAAPIQVGEAVATSAGDLVCKKVIHAPTMHNPGEKADAQAIGCAVEAALEVAEKEGCRSLAIPGMGTGVGGLGKDEAAKAIVGKIKGKRFEHLQLIILLDVDDEMVKAFEKALGKK